MRKQCLNIVLWLYLAGCADTESVFDNGDGTGGSPDTGGEGHPNPDDGAADDGPPGEGGTIDDGSADSGGSEDPGSEGDEDGAEDSGDGEDSDDGNTGSDSGEDSHGEESGTEGDDSSGSGDGSDGGGGNESEDSEGGDSGGDDSGGDDTGTDDDPADFRERGPVAVTTQDDSIDLGNGCIMNTTHYDPEDPATDVTVILVHGFMGARASMAGWAQHFGSWGIPVVAPDLCHATILDADHEQNGRDLALLVDDLGLDSVIFAGFSAGGLASLLAASQVDVTRGLLGLDMVDSGGLGNAVAASVNVTAVDVVSEPSSCNDTGNGVAVFGAMPDARVVRLTDAIHCDFQNPSDGLCSLTCSAPSSPDFGPEDIQTAILGLATAYLAAETGADATGKDWWQPGHFYWDEISSSGLLTEL